MGAFNFGPLTLAVAASLVLAGVHVILSFIMGALTNSETARVEAQRNDIRASRQRLTEAEHALVVVRNRDTDLHLSITQMERRFDQQSDGKLHFDMMIGRPGPGLTAFRAHVSRRDGSPQGRDALVWAHPVVVSVWANSAIRARGLLAEAFPRAQGFLASVDDDAIVPPAAGPSQRATDG
jgi:hypothetical protein